MFMQIDITSKGHDLSDNLKNHVLSKLKRLDKYIHGEAEVDVLLEKNHLGQIVEIKLHANRHRLHSRETTDNTLQCIDKAVQKIESQLRKLKDKMTDWKQ
jgi:putative sigma-54 modulation protein